MPPGSLLKDYRPGAGTGRQAWLRAMCPLGRAGSTPAPGTKLFPFYQIFTFLFSELRPEIAFYLFRIPSTP